MEVSLWQNREKEIKVGVGYSGRQLCALCQQRMKWGYCMEEERCFSSQN